MGYMSQKGYDELVAKLQRMESVDRPAASAAIAEARDKGDLSENAEYDAAKEWQGKLETEIAILKKTIMEAKIIDTTHMDTDTVQILATVELKNVKTGMKMKYRIVSATEADLRAGKISVETPIAKGLLGRRVGDVAEVKVPAGMLQLEVLSISYEE
ncbi:MAG: transcription elongation factor GreA [Bacteroidaceae bacterium]|nr:transcription elongation factor GreA [Bacteroidaceae bacterium]